MKRWIAIAALLLIVVAGSLVAGWLYRDSTEGIPPIPERVVYVQVVNEIKVPEYIEVPGDAPPPKVVERVVFKTLPAPPPEIREVAIACREGADLGTLEGRVTADAVKFVGKQPDGVIIEGWDGIATCELRSGPTKDWVTFVQEPFAFASSRAESVLPPAVPRVLPRRLETRIGGGFPAHAALGASWYDRGKRWGWGAEIGVRLNPEDIYNRQYDSFRQANRYRGTVYLTRRWGRK